MKELTILYEDTPSMKARMQRAALYRGVFLNKFSDLEFSMEMIISNYFCDDKMKADDLRHTLICHSRFMNFDAKKEVLGFIINKMFLEIVGDLKEFLEKITELMKERNIIAHSKVFTTTENKDTFDGETVAFENFEIKKYRAGTKRLTMNSKYLNQKIVEFSKLQQLMDKILSQINSGNNKK